MIDVAAEIARYLSTPIPMVLDMTPDEAALFHDAALRLLAAEVQRKRK